jgi:glycosyltransferase involved in cell wall biosynthesis
MKSFDSARIAIVHEWLVTYAGSERVLEQMLAVFPNADVFCTVDFLPDRDRGFLNGRRPFTSPIQRLPGARTRYRNYLPLMPLAVEQFDLSGYDIVISSSHAVAKGVITGPDQLHVCYCHSPMRYAWDLQHQYLRESGATRGPRSWVARWLLHRMRLWDVRTAHGVDHFVANSGYIARRIEKVYGRDATVIYPPVDVDSHTLRERKENFYLTASRMVPYKKIDLIVEAFGAMPDRHLVVIGSGPDFEKVKGKAGPNVRLLGYQPDQVLRDHMQRARAFVFAAEEDFGIIPVEAQACGTPVIAFGKGGALETVRDVLHPGPTGVFFHEQTAEALAAAVTRFEAAQERFSTGVCRLNALRFGEERFRRELKQFVTERYDRFGSQRVSRGVIRRPTELSLLASGT